MTDCKDTVPSQVVNGDKDASDLEAIRWKTRIECRISVKSVNFKVRERVIGAGSLVRGSYWSEPSSKGGDNRKSRENKHWNRVETGMGQLFLGERGEEENIQYPRLYMVDCKCGRRGVIQCRPPRVHIINLKPPLNRTFAGWWLL